MPFYYANFQIYAKKEQGNFSFVDKQRTDLEIRHHHDVFESIRTKLSVRYKEHQPLECEFDNILDKAEFIDSKNIYRYEFDIHRQNTGDTYTIRVDINLMQSSVIKRDVRNDKTCHWCKKLMDKDEKFCSSPCYKYYIKSWE